MRVEAIVPSAWEDPIDRPPADNDPVDWPAAASTYCVLAGGSPCEPVRRDSPSSSLKKSLQVPPSPKHIMFESISGSHRRSSTVLVLDLLREVRCKNSPSDGRGRSAAASEADTGSSASTYQSWVHVETRLDELTFRQFSKHSTVL